MKNNINKKNLNYLIKQKYNSYKLNKIMLKTGTGTNLGFENEELSDFGKYYQLYNLENASADLKVGSVIEGTIIKITTKYIIIDANNKSNIIVNLDALEKINFITSNVGDVCEVVITSIEDKKDYIITGSVHLLKMIGVDSVLKNTYEKNMIMSGIPTEYNHAGYTVLVNINDETIALFMPHLLTDVNKLHDPNSIIGEEIQFFLDRIKKEGNYSYLVSRKRYIKTLAKKELETIERGGLYRGHVTGSADFAVFVQFGSLTGMIHESNLSEMAQELLKEKKIQPGQEIEFYVKDIIKEKGKDTKLFLTQVIKESLWDSIEIDDILIGKVISIKSFGILVKLDYDTKGLLHESIFTKSKKPMSTYKVGDSVEVYVTNIDKNKRQITLAIND